MLQHFGLPITLPVTESIIAQEGLCGLASIVLQHGANSISSMFAVGGIGKCGTAYLKFPLVNDLLHLMPDHIQSTWQPLSAVVLVQQSKDSILGGKTISAPVRHCCKVLLAILELYVEFKSYYISSYQTCQQWTNASELLFMCLKVYSQFVLMQQITMTRQYSLPH